MYKGFKDSKVIEKNDTDNLEKNDTRNIAQKIQKKKDLAREKQLDTLVTKAYFDSGIKHFPSWIQREDRLNLVPSQIESAKEMTQIKGGKKFEVTELFSQGESYQFWYTEHQFHTPDGEYNRHGELYLIYSGIKVLGVNISVEYDYGFSTQRPFGIIAYRDEDEKKWKSLLDLIVNFSEKRHQEWKKEQERERIEKERSNFGI